MEQQQHTAEHVLEPRVHIDEEAARTGHTDRARKASQHVLTPGGDESAPSDRDEREDWLEKQPPQTTKELVRMLYNDPIVTIPAK